ncbi:MAG TPA: UDP-N-acetylmuramoyl-L-alanyl-D-glutamate--2,6-diaminopimelate ligase [Candidatus Tumulicola sp.]|jgi:UDP-N-acetylmuramoyl-L-alanyl-D-glutamate--2,6-diaminopimelate ligase
MANHTVPLRLLVDSLPQTGRVEGDPDTLISAIETDSRRVRPGALFVALRGEHHDGHAFAERAIDAGAVAVVSEGPIGGSSRVATVAVEDARRALSAFSDVFFGRPSGALDVAGVTGTNGKTTTTHMIAAICNAAGYPCGTIGTIGAEFRTTSWPLEHTTPLPNELHSILAEMRDDGARAVAMEVSSHALALERVDDVRFRIAVLTNVTRDHLDFHQTFDAYAAAKRRLFDLAPSAVLNVDDELGAQWARELESSGKSVTTYGLSENAAVRATGVTVDSAATRFFVDGTAFELQMSGRFNTYNALAAVAVARQFGIDDAGSAAALALIAGVRGRMERIAGAGIVAVVDYAHTPDALERALEALRETTRGSLAVIFGCGGDRDRGKRPQMGAIAARFADRVYLTNDNPRGEDPRAIVDQIVAGIDGARYAIDLDRRHAIERAIDDARAGDTVLIAGKGHETYQIVGDRVLDFDDAAVAREALRRRGPAE